MKNCNYKYGSPCIYKGAMSQVSGSSSSSSDGIVSRMSNSVRQSLVFHKSKRAASNTARYSKSIICSRDYMVCKDWNNVLTLLTQKIISRSRVPLSPSLFTRFNHVKQLDLSQVILDGENFKMQQCLHAERSLSPRSPHQSIYLLKVRN